MSIASNYLLSIALAGHDPNFWCSEEYFLKAGWQVRWHNGFYSVHDQEGKTMLPMISRNFDVRIDDCWAGFSSMVSLDNPLLDYEFIYDPKDFFDLSGGKWSMVRKNLRWAEKDAGEILFLTTKEEEPQEAETFFYALAKEIGDREWYDPEVLVKYMLSGRHRYFLRGMKTRCLYGILAYDYNPVFINFRYCLVAPEIRGLSDTARVAFYRTMGVMYPGILVNDGGSLGSDTLYRYKQRLNPVRISNVKTYSERG